jgi:GMP synthase (glutamine-hydrolysing)
MAFKSNPAELSSILLFVMSRHAKIVILDAGAQYGKLIDRRIRELAVDTDILPLASSAAALTEYAAIIISGGPKSVYAADAVRCDPAIFSLGKPIFGICYGYQLINAHFGGEVRRADVREDGQCSCHVATDCLLFEGLNQKEDVLLTHGDEVIKVAHGFTPVATANGRIVAVANPPLQIFATQFHPEVKNIPQILSVTFYFLLSPTHSVRST